MFGIPCNRLKLLHCLDKKYSLRSAERESRSTEDTMMQQRGNSRSALQTVKFKQINQYSYLFGIVYNKSEQVLNDCSWKRLWYRIVRLREKQGGFNFLFQRPLQTLRCTLVQFLDHLKSCRTSNPLLLNNSLLSS